MSAVYEEYLLCVCFLLLFGYCTPQGMPPGSGGECCRGGGGAPPPPPPGGMRQRGQQPPPGPASGSYYNITIPATIVINYNGNGTLGAARPQNNLPASPLPPNSTAPSPGPGPANMAATDSALPVALPDGSIILYNGNVRLPNNTVLLTKYLTNAVLPVARLPSGSLMFSNGTKVAAGTVTTFPAPGVPLNATEEATVYPSLVLPSSSLIYRNGSILTPTLSMMPTAFVKRVVPACDGVTCHYATS